MIVRIFRARIREGRLAEFKRMVQEQSIPWLTSTDGMLGYHAGEPMTEGSRDFLMVTFWRDLDALRAFAGERWDTPVVTPDEEPLVEAMFADHYLGFDRPPTS
jgi:heme-degrading monooxygenase HmoA